MEEGKPYFAAILSAAFASFLSRFNLYTVNVSLPTISEVFNVGTDGVSLVITVFFLVSTSSLMLFGKLGDRLGLKTIFLSGYAVFILGSLLCGLSGNINSLVGARAVHGLGTSMLLATNFAIIAMAVPKEKLGYAFGINATATALGVAAGAPLGGIIAGYLSWRWVFLLNVPLGLAAAAFAYRFVPSAVHHPRGAAGHPLRGFDFAGALLSFAALSALLFGLHARGRYGWASLTTTASWVAFILFLALFILCEKRHKDPLLDLEMLKNRGFTCTVSAAATAFMLVSGNVFLIPFYLDLVEGVSVAATGMILLTYSLIYVFLSSYAGRLSDRVNPASICVVAMASAAVNTFLFAFIIKGGGLIPVFIFLAWLGFSYVFFLSPANNLAMRLATKGKEGVVSGLLNMAINLSMVLGVEVFEAVFTGSLGDYGHRGASLKSLALPRQVLLNGFSNAYVAGGFMCLFTLCLILLARRRSHV